MGHVGDGSRQRLRQVLRPVLCQVLRRVLRQVAGRVRAVAVLTGAAWLGAAVLAPAGVGAGPAAAAGAAGGWVWPLSGPQVLRPFDPPADRYGAGHRGVDLAGSVVVRAAGAGRVSYAGLLAGRGVVVVVHGSLRTTYEPVTPEVGVGQQVRAGQPLGRLAAGHGGCAASCLHWGLRRGEDYLDPLTLVGGGPPRLLPVPGVPAEGPADAAPAGAEAAAPPAAAPAGPAAPGPAPVPPPRGRFALRAADAPLGGVAVAALVAGIALLRRPRPTPDGPARPGAAPARAARRAGPAGARPAELLDLDEARMRRRPAS